MAVLKDGDRARITGINADRSKREYLMAFGLNVGAEFQMNYSPSYADLICLSLNGKMISLRTVDFNVIEWENL